MTGFFAELRRRNVIRVGVLYLVFAWLILQVADVLFGVTQLPDWSLTLVAIILALGFVPAVVFAWIFELTPEGVKRERDIDRTQSITHRTARRLDLAVIALLVLAIGLLAFERFGTPGVGDESLIPPSVIEQTEVAEDSPSESASDPESDGPSLAVLPFVDMSPDRDQDYFSDGLSDTLIHVLAQIKDLKVVARTSSFEFKGKSADVREIAEKLGVATVLEGSVQKAGNQLRIIAQLIDASSGTHLWSGTFDRSADDIFAIQDEIASEVVKALKGALLEDESQRIAGQYEPSFEAYQAFLRGRQRMAERTSEALIAARNHFQRALELDPDYPLALVNLGDTYRLLMQNANLTIPQAIELAEPLYQRALELAPEMGEPYAGMAGIHVMRGQWERGIASIEKAIELNPGYATAYHWYALILGSMGRPDDALEMLLKAAEIDPLSDVIRTNLISYLRSNGRLSEAMQLANESVRDHPDFSGHYSVRGSLELDRGDLGRYIYWLREAVRRDPGNVDRKVDLCLWLYQLPDPLAAEECARSVAVQHPESDRVVWLQMYGAILVRGEADEGIALGRRYGETTDLKQARGVDTMLAIGYALKGDYERSIDILLAKMPELHPDNDGGEVTGFNWNMSIALAYLWRQTGHAERAHQLVDQVWPLIEGRRRNGPGNMGIADVELHAISGETDQAMAKLTEAVDDGWMDLWQWHFLHSPRLDSLREREDFRALANQVRQRMVEQQQWLEAQPPLHEVIAAGVDLDSI